MYPDDVFYTEDHEWIRDDGGEYIVGITSFAVEQLGDIPFVELPELAPMWIRGKPSAPWNP